MNLDTEIIYCLRYDVHRWSWLGAYFVPPLQTGLGSVETSDIQAILPAVFFDRHAFLLFLDDSFPAQTCPFLFEFSHDYASIACCHFHSTEMNYFI